MVPDPKVAKSQSDLAISKFPMYMTWLCNTSSYFEKSKLKAIRLLKNQTASSTVHT